MAEGVPAQRTSSTRRDTLLRSPPRSTATAVSVARTRRIPTASGARAGEGAKTTANASAAVTTTRCAELTSSLPGFASAARRSATLWQRAAGRRYPSSVRAVAQLGSALRSGRRGRWFKSSQPDFARPPCRLPQPVQQRCGRVRKAPTGQGLCGHGHMAVTRAAAGAVTRVRFPNLHLQCRGPRCSSTRARARLRAPLPAWGERRDHPFGLGRVPHLGVSYGHAAQEPGPEREVHLQAAAPAPR
jgi:hypothetical protein